MVSTLTPQCGHHCGTIQQGPGTYTAHCMCPECHHGNPVIVALNPVPVNRELRRCEQMTERGICGAILNERGECPAAAVHYLT